MAILAQSDESRDPLGLEYAQLLTKSNTDLKTLQGRQATTLLAWALDRNGRSEDAQRLITAVLASGPVAPDGAYFAAEIYAKQRNEELAREALTKALSGKNSFPYHKQAGKLQEALSSTEQVTK